MSATSQLEFSLNGGIVVLTQDGDQVLYPIGGGAMEAAPCMWFALCDHQAVTTEAHPVLGDVPICTRCKEKIHG
jgi:hypothetical protein